MIAMTLICCVFHNVTCLQYFLPFSYHIVIDFKFFIRRGLHTENATRKIKEFGLHKIQITGMIKENSLHFMVAYITWKLETIYYKKILFSKPPPTNSHRYCETVAPYVRGNLPLLYTAFLQEC